MEVRDAPYEKRQAAVSYIQANRGFYNEQERCGGEGVGEKAGRMMDLPHQAVNRPGAGEMFSPFSKLQDLRALERPDRIIVEY